VHFIAGADPRLAEDALEEVLSAALGADRQHSLQVLRGDETTWARVVDAARTGSLFASRRAVVVRGADALKGDGEEMLAYLEDPTPDLALVVVAARPDRRRGIWRALGERAQVHPADPLKGRQLRAYVSDRIKKRGLRLGEDGLAELLERVGADLQRLTGELDKLEAYAQGQPRPLGAHDVASVLGTGLARPVYKLGDALTARRAGECIGVLEELLADGEPPLKLLSTLHHALRRARAALALGKARLPREQLAGRLGVPPFKVDEVMDAARRWTDDDLRAAVEALEQADRRMKTGAEPRSTLAAAVAQACRGIGGPSPHLGGSGGQSPEGAGSPPVRRPEFTSGRIAPKTGR
jgi:DNA polymerase-3 subunit delta